MTVVLKATRRNPSPSSVLLPTATALGPATAVRDAAVTPTSVTGRLFDSAAAGVALNGGSDDGRCCADHQIDDISTASVTELTAHVTVDRREERGNIMGQQTRGGRLRVSTQTTAVAAPLPPFAGVGMPAKSVRSANCARLAVRDPRAKPADQSRAVFLTLLARGLARLIEPPAVTR